jgi:hypothetical protein
MANSFLKPTVIANASVGLLRREVVTPTLFWRNGLDNFQGGVNDTITLRLPAYGVAKTRTLRTAGPLVMSDLHERSVDVKLTTDVYHGVNVTDEELTLDITSFGQQILLPQAQAVARGVEDLAVTAMTGATYHNTVTMDPANPRAALLAAKLQLDLANVPLTGRSIAMGSSVSNALLSDNTLTQVNTSGSSEVLREATIGRLYGFNLIEVPALPADVAIAFHQTAFAMATRSPVVPDGAAFGASANSDGFAMRWIRDYDALTVKDRSIVSTYVGFAVVTDQGAYDGSGRFVPAESPDLDGTPGDAMFIRASKITLDVVSPL